MKTLLVCASRYGATLEIGRWMRERLPFKAVDLFAVEKAPSPEPYDLIFLGGGVYNDQVDQRVVDYAASHLDSLKGKKTAVFAVCLDTKCVYLRGTFFAGWKYLKPLMETLKGQPPIHAGTLGGEINPSRLSAKDYKTILNFYTKALKRDCTEVPYRTAMNKAEVWEFVEKALARLEGKL